MLDDLLRAKSTMVLWGTRYGSVKFTCHILDES